MAGNDDDNDSTKQVESSPCETLDEKTSLNTGNGLKEVEPEESKKPPPVEYSKNEESPTKVQNKPRKASLSHHPSDPGRRRKKTTTKSSRRRRASRGDLSPMTDYECNSHKFEPPFYNHPPTPIGSSQSFTSLLLSRTASAITLNPTTSLNRSSSVRALDDSLQGQSSSTSYWTESSSERNPPFKRLGQVGGGGGGDKKTILNRESSNFWLGKASESTSSIQKIFQNYHRRSLLNRLSSSKSTTSKKWVSNNGNLTTPATTNSSTPFSETDDEDIPAGDKLARQSDVTVGGSRIPPETEYFGFVLYVGSMVVFIAYLLWAFLPIQILHMLNIYYYPSRWWALAFPSFVIVTLVYIYVALLSYNTEVLSQPLNSLSVFVDEYSFITTDTNYLTKSSDGVWDLSLEAVNRVLYSDYSASSPQSISNGHSP